MSPQHIPNAGSQQVSPRISSSLQHNLSPAHLLAGGSQNVESPHWVTRSAPERVAAPLAEASITTADNAWSIRRRGSRMLGRERTLAQRRDARLDVAGLGRCQTWPGADACGDAGGDAFI